MFLPENIDLSSSEKYNLSIRLLPGGFSFAIYSLYDPEVFFYKETTFRDHCSYNESIKKLIFDYNFFTLPFHDTRVTVVSPKYTIVPDHFFDAEQSVKFFDFNVKDNEGKIISDEITETKCHVLYDINPELYYFLSRNLCNPVFTHHAAALIRFFSTSTDVVENGKYCLANFHNRMLDVCCFLKQQLLSINTFPIEHSSDPLYYLSGVWEKLSLDQANDMLYACGDISTHMEVLDTLKKHIRNTSKLDIRTNTISREVEREQIPLDLMTELYANNKR